MSAPLLERRIVPSIAPAPLEPHEVWREFLAVSDDGARIQCVGAARRQPKRLLSLGYRPRYKLELFGVTWYVCDVRQNEDVRFYVAYVLHQGALWARLLYKDGSLLWRCASHFAKSATENWIGKGDLKLVLEDGRQFYYTAEHTTDLPLEMQTALEAVSRRTVRVRDEKAALHLVLRNAPSHRLQAYADFTGPRRRAFANPRNRIHGGRAVAYLRDKADPSSLVIVPGYEPDFRRGILERAESTSVLYCGRLERYRILSVNKKIQYLFFSGPRQVWIIPPQATTTELSSFGVRTVDVVVDEEICCPGFEYHFYDRSEDPPVLCSQIPPGFAGPAAPSDPDRADAAPWLDRLPIIRAFRRSLARRQAHAQAPTRR